MATASAIATVSARGGRGAARLEQIAGARHLGRAGGAPAAGRARVAPGGESLPPCPQPRGARASAKSTTAVAPRR